RARRAARLVAQFLREEPGRFGIVENDVLEAETAVEAARPRVVLLYLERQLAAPRSPSAFFRRRQQFPADAPPPVLRKHGQVVDVQQRLRSKRRQAEEANRNADGMIIGEREEHRSEERRVGKESRSRWSRS